MEDWRPLTEYWAGEFDLSEDLLAAVVWHEGRWAREFDEFGRNDFSNQWALWNSNNIAGDVYRLKSDQEPSIGVTSIRPIQTASPMLGYYWGIRLEGDEVAMLIAHDDRYAIATAAAYLHELQGELALSGHDTDRNLFLAYAMSPNTRARITDKDWDIDLAEGPVAPILKIRAFEQWPAALAAAQGDG